jgi:hypothetical protein
VLIHFCKVQNVLAANMSVCAAQQCRRTFSRASAAGDTRHSSPSRLPRTASFSASRKPTKLRACLPFNHLVQVTFKVTWADIAGQAGTGPIGSCRG